MHNRFKEVRKDNKLTQEQLGKKLGVKRGVIANIELNRVDTNNVLINLFCKEFNVNKEWLLNGIGEKYKKIDEEFIKSLTQEDNEMADIFATLTINPNDKAGKVIRKIVNLEEEYLDALITLIDGLPNK